MFRYDLHIHTDETSRCGRVPAAEVVRLYKEAGYTGLVITDHYYGHFFDQQKDQSWEEKIERYLTGYRIAKQAGIEQDLQVFLGMEICFNESPNDYLIFGLDETFLLDHPKLYDLGLQKFRELTKDKGLLIFQAHPFRKNAQTPPRAEFLDGIETFNGNQCHNSSNDVAAAFAREHNLPQISGSDFHEMESFATGGVLLPRKADNYSDLLKMLLQEKELICMEEICGY